MTKQNDNPPATDPNDDYIGNMWGWKFSWISLGLILFTMCIVIYRGEDAFEDAKQENLFEIQNPHIKRDSL